MSLLDNLKKAVSESQATRKDFRTALGSKAKALKKAIPESARLRNQSLNKRYGIPQTTRRDNYIDNNPRHHHNK